MKGLFTKEKPELIKMSKRDSEDHLKTTHTHANEQRQDQTVIPLDTPTIPQPEHQLNASTPKWSKVEKAVRTARAVSAPGPNKQSSIQAV